MKSKETENSQEIIPQHSGDNLFTRGRYEKKDFKGNPKSRSRSKSKKIKCSLCHKPRHYRRDCPDRKKSFNKPKEQTKAYVAADGYDSGKVFCVADLSSNQNWVLDNGCSFHMSPNKSWFGTFQEIDGGTSHIGK